MPKDDQKEMFVVVDKDDNILGYRTRYDCHHNNKLIHRAIAIVIFNSKGELLMQKRSKSKDTNPGFFSMSAAGHVGKGETYLEAARRELFEELGIKTELRFKKKIILKSNQESEMDAIYEGNFEGPFNIDHDEVEKVDFLSPKKIKKIVDKLTPFALKGLKSLKII
ncbi:hypothetical protein A2954_07530 [Candidatus Roizmanbacteria bacterium RIFCSPLOWO2_01_FULL_37_12]|uniref:isopentenyl-diphosphate Delta-isomerase n=1 Tax=Candidatus Roizmanbacteria bacterium RIFCSPLOWO2_01_FULL_37_12 TaxID=1802056 RepID=A0A1F7IEA3_9BACT|nr:MAG: hypothetical protein A2954_07530 [Candidatus Roizmanbacteria bacterium RIFCSPLOWO2_01_FULL_37_12]